MRLTIILLFTFISFFSSADYGVPVIFQNCNKTLDFATYQFEFVNHPNELYEGKPAKLKATVKSELLANGVIFPEHINSSECQLDKAKIKVWLENKEYLSLSINGIKKVDSIPIYGGAVFFDKIVIDGDGFPKGAERGGLMFCYFGPDKERSMTREYFRVYHPYPSDEVITIKSLEAAANKRNANEDPSYVKSCDGFSRYIAFPI